MSLSTLQFGLWLQLWHWLTTGSRCVLTPLKWRLITGGLFLPEQIQLGHGLKILYVILLILNHMLNSNHRVLLLGWVLWSTVPSCTSSARQAPRASSTLSSINMIMYQPVDHSIPWKHPYSLRYWSLSPHPMDISSFELLQGISLSVHYGKAVQSPVNSNAKSARWNSLTSKVSQEVSLHRPLSKRGVKLGRLVSGMTMAELNWRNSSKQTKVEMWFGLERCNISRSFCTNTLNICLMT